MRLSLTPTRELAVQIGEQLRVCRAPIRLRLAMVIGGETWWRRRWRWTTNHTSSFAAPGRLADHINSWLLLHSTGFATLFSTRLTACSMVDSMQIWSSILKICNPKAQLLMYSATVPPNLDQKMASLLQRVPKFTEVAANEVQTTVATLTQEYLFMPARVKGHLLGVPGTQVCQRLCDCVLWQVSVRLRVRISCLLKVRSNSTAEVVSLVLRELGVKAVSLHSQVRHFLTAEERCNVTYHHRASYHKRCDRNPSSSSSRASQKILVATDVASRYAFWLCHFCVADDIY